MLGFSSVFVSAFLFAATEGVGLPFGIPPMAEVPAIARVAPEQCLFYLSWAGTASPDPKSSNQTEQLLAEPEVQNFLRQIERSLKKTVEESTTDETGSSAETTREEYEYLRHLSTHSGAIFLSKLKIEKKTPVKKSEDNAVEDAEDDDDDENDPPENKTEIAQPAKVLEAESTDLEGRVNIIESSLEKSDVEVDLQSKLRELESSVSITELEGGFILALGDDAPAFERLMEKSIGRLRIELDGVKPEGQTSDDDEDLNEESEIQDIQIESQTWRRIPLDEVENHWIYWGVREGYFLVAIGKEDAIPGMLARMKADPPGWWKAMASQAPVERRTLATYVNLREIGELIASQLDEKTRENAQAAAEILGLANATALVEAWGLDGDNFVNKTFLALDGEPQGLLRLFSEKPLRIDDLAPIPRDASTAMAFRLDMRQVLDAALTAVEKTTPDVKEEFSRKLDEIEKTMDVDLRHGIFDAIDDHVCLYSSPSEGNFFTVVIPLRDGAAFKLAYNRLLGVLEKNLASEDFQKNRKEKDGEAKESTDFAARIDRFEFAGHEILSFNESSAAPSWCVTDREIVIGLLPQDVKAYFARGDRHEPLGADPQIAELLSGEHAPSFLFYANPRSIFRFAYSWFLTLAPTISTELHDSGFDVDLSMFPSLPSLDRHMGPSLAMVRRSPQGIEFASRGTIPLPVDAASIIGVIAGNQFNSFAGVGNNLIDWLLFGPEEVSTTPTGESEPKSEASTEASPPAHEYTPEKTPTSDDSSRDEKEGGITSSHEADDAPHYGP